MAADPTRDRHKPHRRPLTSPGQSGRLCLGVAARLGPWPAFPIRRLGRLSRTRPVTHIPPASFRMSRHGNSRVGPTRRVTGWECAPGHHRRMHQKPVSARSDPIPTTESSGCDRRTRRPAAGARHRGTYHVVVSSESRSTGGRTAPAGPCTGNTTQARPGSVAAAFNPFRPHSQYIRASPRSSRLPGPGPRHWQLEAR